MGRPRVPRGVPAVEKHPAQLPVDPVPPSPRDAFARTPAAMDAASPSSPTITFGKAQHLALDFHSFPLFYETDCHYKHLLKLIFPLNPVIFGTHAAHSNLVIPQIWRTGETFPLILVRFPAPCGTQRPLHPPPYHLYHPLRVFWVGKASFSPPAHPNSLCVTRFPPPARG